MEQSNSYQEIAERILAAQKFIIFSHESPDPDAYASSLGLSAALKKLGKEVTVHNISGIVRDLGFLPMIQEIKDALPEINDHLVITTDSAALNRIGKVYTELLAEHGVDINIDHHVSNEFFGKLNLVQGVSSCSEMIFKLIKELDVQIDQPLANLLLAGIYSDTGSLQYKGVSSETFRIVAELMDLKADLQTFSQKLFQEKSLGVLKLQAKMIEQVNLLFNNQFAYLVIPSELVQEFNVSEDELHHVKDIFRHIAGVKVSATIREYQGQWRASLRSVDPVDVNQISKPLGGGGHTQAAGIKWKKSVEEFLEGLISGVETELRAKKCL